MKDITEINKDQKRKLTGRRRGENKKYIRIVSKK